MNTHPYRQLAGQCTCGSVRYDVADEFEYAANCQCLDCRRATGSAFKPFAGIARGKFRICEGAADLQFIGNDIAHDGRCKTCGSLLYSLVRDGQYVHVTMGTLTDDPSIRPTGHIFVASKAPWYIIADDLPRYAGHVSG